MRRLLALFVLCIAPLALAVAPKPTPAPTATPKAAAAAPKASASPKAAGPVVEIFPFETPSDVEAKYGLAVANIYATALTESGGVSVLAIPPVIKREDYQTYAHIHHADYYISGYIQPIGGNASIVSQVVDVNTGIAIYSATTEVADVQDIGSQALNARTAILQYAGIDRPQLQEASQATPAPAATASGASMQITSLVGDLFHGKGRKGASATPTPAPAKPARGVIIARLLGNAPATTLSAGTGALYRSVDRYYKTTMSPVATANLTNQADSICGAHRDNTIASGLLDVTHVGGFRAHDTYTFTLQVYACFGAVLYTDTEHNDDYQRAIDAAVSAYETAHPKNNG